MNRQVNRICVWVLLGIFLSFSTCLPLGHVCLHQAGEKGYTAHAAVQHLREPWRATRTREISAAAHRLGEIHKDDFCQACMLAQNLILDRGAVDLIEQGKAEPALDRVYMRIIAAADYFESSSKRAPPAIL